MDHVGEGVSNIIQQIILETVSNIVIWAFGMSKESKSLIGHPVQMNPSDPL